ncbi:MAG: SUMF1/EgtB/PvdO family nonheme iron enzyme [Planctomycetes bacterium]|nr:SUMF1/EgtB/PvdO family nonheme iron enzyme [Planctomycetota bacterium]
MYCAGVRRGSAAAGEESAVVSSVVSVSPQSVVSVNPKTATQNPKWEDVPDGFVVVPGGEFIFGGEAAGGDERQVRNVPDFFIAKFPVTCAEYLEFLNDGGQGAGDGGQEAWGSPLKGAGQSAEGPEPGPEGPGFGKDRDPESGSVVVSVSPVNSKPETRNAKPEFVPVVSVNPQSKIQNPKSKRVPRESEESGYYWEADPTGLFRLPGPGERPLKGGGTRQDGRPDWPVVGVSWYDAIAFCEWKSRKEGRVYRLPTAEEWEKAARGVDGRIYPFGRHCDPTYCNINSSHKDGMRLEPVESFPIDESPVGVRGMGGNSRDWCLDDPGERYRSWRYLRGGAWVNSSDDARTAFRWGNEPTNVNWNNGFRLCVSGSTSRAGRRFGRARTPGSTDAGGALKEVQAGHRVAARRVASAVRSDAIHRATVRRWIPARHLCGGAALQANAGSRRARPNRWSLRRFRAAL